jgi:BCD family chlorophyll transporter-like MFS transporter
MTRSTPPPLGWPGILRLGLVQTALGAIIVLTTSTLNRVMVVEFLLPAMLPGALVALHHFVQISRPRWGYGSDVGGRRTPWIIGGMALLALGGILASSATAWMASDVLGGTLLAILAFTLIGVGVGACGTSLLVLLAKRVGERQRAAAATTVWLMMIVGFIVTATTAGHFLDPFSPERLVMVTTIVAAIAFIVTLIAIYGIEGEAAPTNTTAFSSAQVGTARGNEDRIPARHGFREAMAQVWSEPKARRFAIFVFFSMLAYSAQDLILEPFAGTVFGLTPGESTRLAGVQNGGVLGGMILLAVMGSSAWGRRFGTLQDWTVRGCIASAAALIALSVGGFFAPAWPLHLTVFFLGLANGLFAVAAIGSMMGLVDTGQEHREGVRMGLWGAAQALAFGLGGFLGTVAVDLARYFMESPVMAYASVFTGEALMFLLSAVLAVRVNRPLSPARPQTRDLPAYTAPGEATGEAGTR